MPSPRLRPASRGPACLLAFLLAAPVAQAAVGGPDGFGYTWRDSAEIGFDYAWFDPGITGTDITAFGDDTTTGFLPISFNFPYYGGSYNQIAVCSNGWLSLVDGSSTNYINGALPTAGTPVGTIAAFWDDLRLTEMISTVFLNDLGDRAVVTWANAHDLGDEAAVNTFQVILHQDGRIVVQYRSLLGDLTSCTLGIESPDEANGLSVYVNEIGGVPSMDYAVEFSPPVPVPNDLDCGSATPVGCGDWITGDTNFGTANQDGYLCSRNDYSGREQLYTLDLATPTTVRLILEASSGNPEIVLLDGCDPNRCVTAPTDSVLLNDAMGTFTIVIDSAPGDEGSYRLRVECLPLPPDFDCIGAPTLSCPETVSGDLRTSDALQDYYWCLEDDFSGAEDVYVLDLPSPATVQLAMTVLSGNPDLIVLDGCNPGVCLGSSDEDLVLEDVMGTLVVVVDSRPGEEGEYELALNCLQDSFTFCGDGLFESEPWNDDGSWLVFGWLYHPGDTHNFALRVDDGVATYTHDTACTQFPSASFGVIPPSGPGFVTWDAPEARVEMTMSETSSGGCCGLLVQTRITNTDTVPHSYDWRIYHDTAFGTGSGMGACGTGTVDGGSIQIMGNTQTSEVELLPLGGATCEGQVQMFSADDPSQLVSSFEMLPPNLPSDMEFLDWDDGGQPCTTWQDLVDGEAVAGCTGAGGDNSLLLIWRFPETAGTLAPGESAVASYRIGHRCAFPCNVACEDPVMSAGVAADLGPCNDGVDITWDPAVFPGSGNGVYHVRRSTISFADARLQPPLTPLLGLSGTSFIDTNAPPNVPLYYVVEAESLDFPDCGTGIVVNGSTDDIEIGPITDDADVDGPIGNVGNSLRATAHTDTTVDFNWLLSPMPGPGETYVVFRADDDPQGPFLQLDTPAVQVWTDPDAPPRFDPVHVWFYDVRLVDACGNPSDD